MTDVNPKLHHIENYFFLGNIAKIIGKNVKSGLYIIDSTQWVSAELTGREGEQDSSSVNGLKTGLGLYTYQYAS